MIGERARNVVLISIDTLRHDCVGLCPDKAHAIRDALEPAFVPVASNAEDESQQARQDLDAGTLRRLRDMGYVE